MGVVNLARRSRPQLAHVALIVFFPGLIALTAIVGMELVLWQMAQPEANRAEMISLLERLNGSAGIEPLFAVALLFPFAWLLGGLGLHLSRAAPLWAAAAIGLSQPIGFIGGAGRGTEGARRCGAARVRHRPRSDRRPAAASARRAVGEHTGHGRRMIE